MNRKEVETFLKKYSLWKIATTLPTVSVDYFKEAKALNLDFVDYASAVQAIYDARLVDPTDEPNQFQILYTEE